MAALTVLKEIGSKKLQDYLRMAEEDGREHVVAKAKELRREA
jgi:hypothetical protein